VHAYVTGWTTEVRFPAGGEKGFFSSSPHPDRLRGPPSLPSSGYRIPSLGVKRPEPEADHSPPPTADVKNALIHTFSSLVRIHGTVLN
jgi:hypothetical protein